MVTVHGAGARAGKAAGVLVWLGEPYSKAGRGPVPPAGRPAEVRRLRTALEQAALDLEAWAHRQDTVVARVALTEYREALLDAAFVSRAVAQADGAGAGAAAAVLAAASQIGAVLERSEALKAKAAALRCAAEWVAWRLEPPALPDGAVVGAERLNPLALADWNRPALLAGPEPELLLTGEAPVVWGVPGLGPDWAGRRVRVAGTAVTHEGAASRQGRAGGMRYEEARAAVCQYARRMWQDGLVKMTSGNVSCRIPATEHFVVTPSGMEYDSLTPADICVVDLAGQVVDGARRPSTETPLHRLIYQCRPDVGAVVHTHSVYATAFACLGVPLEPVSTELAGFVGATIPCARYARSGTDDFGTAALAALGAGGLAALLQNHGAVAVGPSLRKAYSVALGLEEAAMVYAIARHLGTPITIPLEERERIFREYQRSYGQPKEG